MHESFNLPNVIYHKRYYPGDEPISIYYEFKFFQKIAKSRHLIIPMENIPELVNFFEGLDNVVHLQIIRGMLELTFTNADDATQFALEFM